MMGEIETTINELFGAWFLDALITLIGSAVSAGVMSNLLGLEDRTGMLIYIGAVIIVLFQSVKFGNGHHRILDVSRSLIHGGNGCSFLSVFETEGKGSGRRDISGQDVQDNYGEAFRRSGNTENKDGE